MSSQTGLHRCDICQRKFSIKSNLNRHIKTHSTPEFTCTQCNKSFHLKWNLERHKKLHLYPVIKLYKPDEARLKRTEEAENVAKQPTKETSDNAWLKPETAEAEAKRVGGEHWQACVQQTWGQYKGKTFSWLLENDVGWIVWLLAEFIIKGEIEPLMWWQKQTLLDLVKKFPLVMVHVDKRTKHVKVRSAYISLNTICCTCKWKPLL